MPLVSLAFSYGAGALSTLSPCVLPLLPIVVIGAVEQHRFGPIALAAGLAGSFAATGLFIASIGLNLGIDSGVLRSAVAVLMMGLGIVLLVPALQMALTSVAAPLTSGGNGLLARLSFTGIRGQFLLGLLLGAVWSPCAGPTLGVAIGLAAQSATMFSALALLLVFGIGAATPVLALAYGSRQAMIARRNSMAQASRMMKPVAGAVMLAVGLFVITGLDKIVETHLTSAMPDWLVNVTTRL
ncbi:cytochrome c biogenesis CcdA family protein [Tardiphaga sp.]|uniref:cytochrome c biogenesis CcdA family protein n=1 Tax=Tardiphaga sp. TaxID=1926292 RepID=UPI0025E98FA2|nr:cytochrome c biogenesis CcdA family protein [Tardiphaga sp.]